MATSDSLIDLTIAVYKDKVLSETFAQLRSEAIALAHADADARREKAHEIIMSMARLQMSLDKFRATYELVANRAGRAEAIESYMRGIESLIKNTRA